MLKEILEMAVFNLYRRKTRTFLTILGVVIGVAAIVGMVGAVQGVSQSINAEIEKFHSNIIEIMPGSVSGQLMSFGYGAEKQAELTDDDVKMISNIPGVKLASGEVWTKATVSYRDEKIYGSIYGLESALLDEMVSVELEDGRFFNENEGNAMIIGNDIAHDVFDRDIRVGNSFVIDGEEFKVVGILKSAGGGMFSSYDTMLLMDRDRARDKFGLDEDRVDAMVAVVEEGADIELIGDEIEEKLCRKRGNCDDPDFYIVTPEFTKGITGQITSMLQTLIGGIAGISLVVGAIGIANMMYTSVLERIREIGILKATGATNHVIMLLFLFESGIIGFVGGIMGILFGILLGEGFLYIRAVLAGEVINGVGASSTLSSHILLTPELVFGAMGFSIIIGVLAGVFPARKAAKLQPIEALRYE